MRQVRTNVPTWAFVSHDLLFRFRARSYAGLAFGLGHRARGVGDLLMPLARRVWADHGRAVTRVAHALLSSESVAPAIADFPCALQVVNRTPLNANLSKDGVLLRRKFAPGAVHTWQRVRGHGADALPTGLPLRLAGGMIDTVGVLQWIIQPVGTIAGIVLYRLYARDHGWAGWILIALYVLLLFGLVVATLGSLLAGEYWFFLPLLGVTGLWAFVVWKALAGFRK